ncbi:hypothetical protein [Lentiprolixibacter aurantiacus]|uniref:Uncharacterized protein n=1 Tax=Lentiprolixibacter aurantiacus TaxID=2993939 RepID=A0AAE3SMS3_9FLAO|nr:hypothetical protein [Lentiprolixibacter aurantiacus]MCX2718755.1 hypothetical protein [Lentiprolixibacter aurantiacus]
MPFTKGHEKIGGRKKGTPNRITKELRNVLKEIIAQELEHLPSYLESIPDKKRIEILLKLMPYVFPRLNPISFESGEPVDFSYDKY